MCEAKTVVKKDGENCCDNKGVENDKEDKWKKW